MGQYRIARTVFFNVVGGLFYFRRPGRGKYFFVPLL